MSKSRLQAPRGTRDFYPDEMRLRSWLFAHFREVSRRFGFEEIDAPIVEHAELFIRKAGEEIVDQLYHFELHDRHLALRPELTPSIARMVMARAGSLRLPVRWYTIGQNWRYERMTRGRKREHYQWDVEIIGEADVTAEAELLAAIFALLDRVGLGDGQVRVRVNSRALLEESLRSGVLRDQPDAFEPLCVIIDKLSKIGADAVVDQLSDGAGPVGLSPDSARDVVDLLSVRTLADAATAAPADSEALTSLTRLFGFLDAYGVADRVDFDASVVRGLAYYTGVVFEAFDAAGALRAVCGGGRYDRLLGTLGGSALPAVGFGFGDVVVAELLGDQGLLPEPARGLDAVVFPLEEAQRPAAVALARRLRDEGQAVELVLGHSRPKRVLGDADKSGARRVYLIGADEVAAGAAKVRDLAEGTESEEPLAP